MKSNSDDNTYGFSTASNSLHTHSHGTFDTTTSADFQMLNATSHESDLGISNKSKWRTLQDMAVSFSLKLARKRKEHHQQRTVQSICQFENVSDILGQMEDDAKVSQQLFEKVMSKLTAFTYTSKGRDLWTGFRRLDADRDGMLKWKEFQRIIRKQESNNLRIHDVLEHLDTCSVHLFSSLIKVMLLRIL